jgi:hypothetical protein
MKLKIILMVQPSMKPPGGGQPACAWILQALRSSYDLSVLFLSSDFCHSCSSAQMFGLLNNPNLIHNRLCIGGNLSFVSEGGYQR